MGEGFRTGFFISGQGRLFRAAANARARLGITPSLVVAESGAAADLEDFCARRRIPFERLEPSDRRAFDHNLTRLAVDGRLDLLCLTFARILPDDLVGHYRRRIINVHPALLPSFPGINALGRAVTSGARFSGATIHEVTEAVDAGPIVAQCLLGIRRHETGDAFGQRLFIILRLMFLQVLAWYGAGRVVHDDQGQVWIRNAVYGELPISPAVELDFAEQA